MKNPIAQPLIPAAKPSLDFLSPPAELAVVSPTIGFVFPDGKKAIKAAALEAPVETPDGLFEVGVVEIGPDLFKVAIDLEDQPPASAAVAEDETGPGAKNNEADSGTVAKVEGRLLPVGPGEATQLYFSRTRQILNPERTTNVPDPLPLIHVSLSSTGVCFVVARGDEEVEYTRYCSLPAEDGTDPLSVRANFAESYEELVAEIDSTVTALLQGGYLGKDSVQRNMTAAELESPAAIKGCVDQNQAPEACGADIAGAPTSDLWENYHSLEETSEGEPFAVTAGVVRVFQPLAIDGNNVVQPGSYAVDYWFETGPSFLGATLSGVLEDGQTEVERQQIPATEALFIDPDNPEEIVSQISAWRLGRACCFWQRNCP